MILATGTRIPLRVRLFLRKHLYNLLKSEGRTLGNGCLLMAKTTTKQSDFPVRSDVRVYLEMEK